MSDKFSELQPGSFIYTLPNALDADFCRKVIERFESAVICAGAHGPGGTTTEYHAPRIFASRDWRSGDAMKDCPIAAAWPVLLGGLHPFFQAMP